MSETKVSIIVPTYRRPEVLKETLNALINLDFPKNEYEIIVVDDGSQDKTAEIVQLMQIGFSHLIYHYQKNSGVATARNEGARLAKGEVLIFNDDDIVVPSDLIKLHLKHLSEFGKCLVNGHWEFPIEMANYFKETPFGRFRIATEVWVKEDNDKKLLYGSCYEASGVSACNLAVRLKDFWYIGGFDEQFPFAGFEDYEFSKRAGKAGYKFIYDYNLKLCHNDHRINIEQFGERQRRGAITKVLLATKYPEDEANHPMIVENGFVKSGEPLKRTTKKLVKKIAAAPGASSLAFALTRFLEKNWKNSFLLPRLYNVACGIYIFRGIREGLARYGEPQENNSNHLATKADFASKS